MALIFKFDEQQLERLITAVNNLSDNVAKWQSENAQALQQGLSGLIEILGGIPVEEVQAHINQLRDDVKTEADALEGSAQSGD